jgi:cellulose biosynthesis protein BcsQ
MIMGIAAFENIIIPLDCGVFAYETLSTLKSLVLELNKELGISTNLMMMLLREGSNSVFDKFQTYEIKRLLKGFLRENNLSSVEMFTIPFSRKIHNAQMRGLPVSHLAPYSDVGRAYKRITKGILKSSE